MDLDLEQPDTCSSGTTITYNSPSTSNLTAEIDENGNQNKLSSKPPTDWQIICPKYKHRFFYKIIMSSDASVPVQFWIDEYEINNHQAMFALLQLFVDICGIQNFNVERFLDDNEMNDIVTNLECWPNSTFKQYGKYLLKLRSKRFLYHQKKIQIFMVTLIKQCAETTEFFYDSFMMNNSMSILKSMATSKFRHIRHTGVFLGLKCITGLVMVKRNMFKKRQMIQKDIEKVDLYSEAEVNEMKIKLETLYYHFKYINKYIHFLYHNIFIKNWNLFDKALNLMRVECILEIEQWIKILPEEYLKNNVLDIALSAMTEDCKFVRHAAMQVFMGVLDSDRFTDHLADNIKKYSSIIGGRILDVDINNAVFAVDILCVINKYHKSVSTSLRNRIFLKIYCHNYPLAAACGRFLAQKLLRRSEKKIDILYKLVTFQVVSEKEQNTGPHRIPLLVEALIDHLPALQDVSIYIHLFKNQDLDDHYKRVLVDIFCEVLHITTCGTCSLPRQSFRQGKIDEQLIESMVQDIMEELQTFADVCDTPKFKEILSILHKCQVQQFIWSQAQETIV